MTRVRRMTKESAQSVRDWCRQAGDHNQYHLDDQAASSTELFDGAIVPGMLMLDSVSGLVTQWGETIDADGYPILLSVENVSFERPVPVGEMHEVELWDRDEVDDGIYELPFKVIYNGDTAASGTVLASVR